MQIKILDAIQNQMESLNGEELSITAKNSVTNLKKTESELKKVTVAVEKLAKVAESTNIEKLSETIVSLTDLFLKLGTTGKKSFGTIDTALSENIKNFCEFANILEALEERLDDFSNKTVETAAMLTVLTGQVMAMNGILEATIDKLGVINTKLDALDGKTVHTYVKVHEEKA